MTPPHIRLVRPDPADNRRIASAAEELILLGGRARPELIDLRGLRAGLCLQFVRRIVEVAHGWPSGEFYTRYGVRRAYGYATPATRSDWAWWASDIDASLEELGHAVDHPRETLEPGDLVTRASPDPYGHIGIVTPDDGVLELVDPTHRPDSLVLRGTAVCLTPADAFAAAPMRAYRLDRAAQARRDRATATVRVKGGSWEN